MKTIQKSTSAHCCHRFGLWPLLCRCDISIVDSSAIEHRVREKVSWFNVHAKNHQKKTSRDVMGMKKMGKQKTPQPLFASQNSHSNIIRWTDKEKWKICHLFLLQNECAQREHIEPTALQSSGQMNGNIQQRKIRSRRKAWARTHSHEKRF